MKERYIKISFKDYINLALNYLIVFLLFSGIVDYRPLWHLFIIFMYGTLVVFTIKSKNLKIDVYEMILLFIIGSLFLLSMLISPTNNVAFNNFRSCLYSLCSVGIFMMAVRQNKEIIVNKLIDNIKFFNVMLIINIIVLAIQSKGTGFLIKSAWLAENSYYEDHCAGLFGKNSTNVLAIYSIFVMLLNLYYSRKYIDSKKKKVLFIVFTMGTQGVMAILSQFNDNVGFYFMLAIFIIYYIATLIIQGSNLRKLIIHGFGYLILVIIAIFILYNIPSLNAFFNNVVADRLYRVFYYNHISGGASGSSERLAVIEYALSLPSSFMFGKGVGTMKWIPGKAYGFDHFGINSAGSYILLGGLGFYLSYCFLYSHFFSMMMPKKVKKTILKSLMVFLVVVFFSIYTTLFNDARTVVTMALIFSSASVMDKNNKVCEADKPNISRCKESV